MSGYQGKHVARNQRVVLLLAVVAAVVMVLAAVVIIYQKYWDKTPKEPDTSQANPLGASSHSGDVSQPNPVAPDEPKAPSYNFSQPVPEREGVDNSYFDDAAFVGDSRTDGFMQIGRASCRERV